MDTIENGTFETGLDEYVINRVRKIGRFHCEGRSQRGYHFSAAYWIDGHHAYFKWGRKDHSLPVLKVNFSLSKFDSFQEFLKWSGKSFGDAHIPLIDGPLNRLDTCIDLSSPFKFVQGSLIQPRARSERYIADKKKTLQLGRYPRKTTVYEKEIKCKELDQRKKKHSKLDPNSTVAGTRIEVQHWGRKVPIKCLREIEKLRDFNPFSHLKTLNQGQYVVPDDLPFRTKNILWAFQKRCEEIGPQQARKEFNKNRNFNRTIGKYIGVDNSLDLEKYWLRRVSRFLGKGPIDFTVGHD